jgi:hypothetical protein
LALFELMGLKDGIQSLRAELERIKGAIVCLEQLRDGTAEAQKSFVKTRDRRGRKFMPPEERKEVSARMKRYWASLRKRREDK